MFDFNKDTGLVRMYGPIGQYFDGGISSLDFMAMLDEMDGRDINIQIKSDGGEIGDGVSIYNQIDTYPGRVSVEIDALAASIASVIPMTADNVTMRRGSMIMIHNPWTIAMGDAKELRGYANLLEKLGEEIAALYAQKTGQSIEDMVAAMDAETWYGAEDALQIGLIDAIASDKPQVAPTENRAVAVASAFPRLARNKSKVASYRLKH